ncbi:hypothetical protein IWQ56_000145 [Coemansia nantahalensis]|nr:hypothetical protein IWQ56_000145 [Coemansia nantahalensis]
MQDRPYDTVAVPKQAYRRESDETHLIPDDDLSADVAFYYGIGWPPMKSVHMIANARMEPELGAIDDTSLGRVADFVYHIWQAQPTRIFVPHLFVHGPHIDLLLFTRDKWYRARIGDILYSRQKPRMVDVECLCMTLACLWFIMTLPSDQFGHICDVSEGRNGLVFTHEPKDKTDATVTVRRADEHRVFLKEPLPRLLRMRGQLAHVYTAKYKGKEVILKMTWMPANRPPEGAIYDALAAKKVGGVPEVFDSGVLRNNVFGYRMEYLILEYCGEQLDNRLANLLSWRIDDDAIQKRVIQTIEQVSACLVSAWSAGIFHRDISPESIALFEGRATVFDWGCAKVCNSAGLESVEDAWGLSFDKVGSVCDKQTGAPHFVSIGALFGLEKRDVYDDLESLFYVALYAFGKLNNEKIHKARGFRLYSNQNLALVRSSVLSDSSRYMEAFGVGYYGGVKVGDDLCKVFDALYRFLFWSHSEYIGCELWEDQPFKRVPDLQLAAQFMGKEAVQILERALATQNGAQPLPAPASVSNTQPPPAPTLAPGDQMGAAPARHGSFGRDTGGSHAPRHRGCIARPGAVGRLSVIHESRGDSRRRDDHRPRRDSRRRDARGTNASGGRKRKSEDGGD